MRTSSRLVVPHFARSFVVALRRGQLALLYFLEAFFVSVAGSAQKPAESRTGGIAEPFGLGCFPSVSFVFIEETEGIKAFSLVSVFICCAKDWVQGYDLHDGIPVWIFVAAMCIGASALNVRSCTREVHFAGTCRIPKPSHIY